jgi:hypothetical protein
LTVINRGCAYFPYTTFDNISFAHGAAGKGKPKAEAKSTINGVAGAALGATAGERVPESESERTAKSAAEGVSDTFAEYILAGSGATLSVSHSGSGESQGTVTDGVES